MNHSIVIKIMRNEWRAMWHARIPAILLGLLMLLLVVASFASQHDWQHHAQTVAKANQQSNQDWQSQPNRHPHRVSHYGDFVVKPIHLLSVIEPGIIDQSGHLVYLEGHRLNSTNFNPATEFTSLGRFPTITPAAVIQWFMPLLLIMAGYACITRERAEGTLQYLIGNGTHPARIVMGKWLALYLPVMTVLLAFSALFSFFVWQQPEGLLRLGIMVIGQCVYLASWCLIVVAVSWNSRHLHSALLALLLLWVCVCVIFPKGLANLAQIAYPTHPRTEAEYHAEQKLKTIGDSHNPNDPHFAEFKANILKRYGVHSTDELPVNYNGLLMQEGERLTTAVYREQQALHQTQLLNQNAWIRKWLWLSPALALQYVQTAASGSDIAHHHAFIEQSEQRRFGLISYLNQLHAEQVDHHDDKNQRLEADFWKRAPRPTIQLAPLHVSATALIAAIAVLLFWLLVPLMLLLRTLKHQ